MCSGGASFPSVLVPPAFLDNNYTGKTLTANANMLDSDGESDQRRVTEVLTFDPVGHLKSSFGHTAININGTIYAFGEKGWYKQTTATYLQDNSFRDAVGQELNLSPQEQDILVKMIEQDMAEKPQWSS